MSLKKYDVQSTALLGELFGTFVLATIAITVANPIIVGFVLIALVLSLGAISGAHLNPAVTFGFWSVKKINSIKALLYVAVQFVGAGGALLISQLYKGTSYGLSFSSFAVFDSKIMLAEMIAMVVFTFAIAAAIHRELQEAAKGLAIGLGLLAALAIGGGLLGQAAQNSAAITSKPSRISLVDGVVVNPAIALASTEKDLQSSAYTQLEGKNDKKEVKKPISRLGLETILGGLLGGAIGMNLYFLTAGVNPFEKKGVTATVSRIVKKGSKKNKK